jgi:hypothetical protein
VTLRRSVLGLGATAATVLLVSGCNWFSSADEGARTIQILKVTNNTFDYVVVGNLTDGSLKQLGSEFTAAVDQQLSIKPVLDRVAASDDPYGEAIASATCTGLQQVASSDETAGAQPTDASWERFLINQVHVLLPANPVNRANAAVKRFTTTADLASINPRLAAFYFRECSRR